MPLYLCQNGFLMRLLPIGTQSKSIGSNEVLDKMIALLSPLPERTSPAHFASHRWEVVASMTTIVVYIVLNGVALLACCIAQLLAGIAAKRSGRRSMPKLSQFPALDLFTQCTIEDEDRYVVYQGRPAAFHCKASQNSQMAWLSTMSVKLSRPLSVENGLRLLGLQVVNINAVNNKPPNNSKDCKTCNRTHGPTC